MVLQKKVVDIIKEIAERKQLPYNVVEAAVLSQFKTVKQELEKGEKGNFETFRNVRLMHLGLIYTTEKKINAINKQKQKKEDE
jgi:nucleoid DNA-binding protein